jgi:TP901 family phage tail tape measure protein
MAERTENTRINLYINNAQATAAMDGFRKQINDIRKDQKKLEVGSKEWMDQHKKLQDVQKKMMDYSKSVDKASMSVNQLKSYSSALKRMKDDLIPGTKAFNDLDKELKKVSVRLETVRTGISPFQKVLKSTGDIAKGVGVAMLGAFGAAAIFQKIKNAIDVFTKFEQANANLAAVLGKSKKDISALSEEAKKYGATTAFTASQVSSLQTELAKLGFTEKEISKATKSTLALAAATGSDLANAAAVAGATVRGFGLDAEETGRVTDVMASSFSKSALDLEKFKESMKLVAPIAKAANIDVETTTGLLGKLADAGLSGSIAGTSLKNLLSKLSDGSSTLSKQLGFTVTSSDDLFKAFELLRTKNIDLTEATELTDERSKAAFLTLIDGSEAAKKLTSELRNAGGAAEKMAKTQLDTLSGKMTILGSAWEGFVLSLEDGNGAMASVMKNTVEFATNILSFLADTRTAAQKTTDAWREQKETVQSLEKEMNPLIDRHDELQNKSELSKDEQEELEAIIAKVADTIPFAITGFDEYGKAMGISSDKAREFVELQQAMLSVKNKEAIKEQEIALSDLNKQIEATIKALNKRNQQGDLIKTVLGTGQMASSKEVKLTTEEIQNLQQTLNNLQFSKKGTEGILNELRGIKNEISEVANAEEETQKKITEIDKQEIEKRKKAWDKLQADKKKALESFYNSLNSLRDEQWERSLDDQARELVQADKKFEAARANAQKVLEIEGLSQKERTALEKQLAAELQQINELHQIEIGIINKKHIDKRAEEELKIYNESRKKIEDAVKYHGLTKQEIEIKQVEETHRLLMDLKVATIEEEKILEEQKAAAIAAINEKYRQTEKEAWANALQLQMNKTNEFYNSGMSVITSFADLRAQQENQDLAAYKNSNDQKKAALEKRLKSGQLSEENYRKQIEQLDRQQDKKEREIRRDQFERERRIKTLEILMNTATAITKAIAMFGPPPSPAGIAGIAAAGITGGLQLATVASAQPQFGDGGIFREGVSHAHPSGGMPVLDPRTGKVLAKVEQGEGFVNKDSTAANEALINLMNANRGRTITPDMLGSVQPSVNIGRASQNLLLEKGGILDKGAASSTIAAAQPAAMPMADQSVINLLTQIRDKKAPAVIYLQELKKELNNMEELELSNQIE